MLISLLRIMLNIHEIVATEGAGALVATLEPAEQTHGVECVLAGGTTLVRGLHIGRDDRVTDGTLALTLECTLYVPTESEETINQVSVGKHDDSLDREKPALPFLLVHKHPTTADHLSWMQWVRWRQGNCNRDGGRLFIHGYASDDLRCLGGNLDAQCSLFVGILS